MKHIAIALALVFAVPLSSCAMLTATNTVQAQQTATQALIISEVAYTQAVRTITALVASDTLKGASLQRVLAIRDKARRALDSGDGLAAMAATSQLTLAVGAS